MPEYWVPGEAPPKPHWRPGYRRVKFLTLPGELHNKIYNELISGWEGGIMNFPARTHEEDPTRAGVRYVDLRAVAQSCRRVRRELMPLMEMNFPIYDASVPLQFIDQIFHHTILRRTNIPTVHFRTTRPDQPFSDHFDKEFDLRPTLVAISHGIGVSTEHLELEIALQLWKIWWTLIVRGVLRHISFSESRESGFRLHYTLSNEIGELWQLVGYKETERRFPTIGYLNTKPAVFRSKPWGNTVRKLSDEGIASYPSPSELWPYK